MLEPLGPARQAELGRHRREEERLWLVARAPVTELCASGELVPELARVLHPSAIEVPPLSLRRAELHGLVHTLAENAARRGGQAAPTWSDAALAVLFRQPWVGQVAELRGLVEELVQHGPGALQAEHVRAALAAHGLACCERLTTAHGRDLEAALALTRHRNGNRNAARAARYLGWSREAVKACLDRAQQHGAEGVHP